VIDMRQVNARIVKPAVHANQVGMAMGEVGYLRLLRLQLVDQIVMRSGIVNRELDIETRLRKEHSRPEE